MHRLNKTRRNDKNSMRIFKNTKIGNYAGLGVRQVDPCITGLDLCIVVVRQYVDMFSATTSDLADNRNVFILGY